MPRLIDADALARKWQYILDIKAEEKDTVAYTTFELFIERLKEEPTIDPESLRPQERCRYCSPEDGAGVEWDLEDIEVSMTLRCGKLTISNSFGDEADVPIRYCPICGAKMDLEEETP